MKINFQLIVFSIHRGIYHQSLTYWNRLRNIPYWSQLLRASNTIGLNLHRDGDQSISLGIQASPDKTLPFKLFALFRRENELEFSSKREFRRKMRIHDDDKLSTGDRPLLVAPQTIYMFKKHFENILFNISLIFYEKRGVRHLTECLIKKSFKTFESYLL